MTHEGTTKNMVKQLMNLKRKKQFCRRLLEGIGQSNWSKIIHYKGNRKKIGGVTDGFKE